MGGNAAQRHVSLLIMSIWHYLSETMKKQIAKSSSIIEVFHPFLKKYFARGCL